MTSKILGTTKVCDVFRMYPKAADYLLELKICECEGMHVLKSTIEEEAKNRGLDLEKLLVELNKRA